MSFLSNLTGRPRIHRWYPQGVLVFAEGTWFYVTYQNAVFRWTTDGWIRTAWLRSDYNGATDSFFIVTANGRHWELDRRHGVLAL